ncbi:MAG: MarR family winged helix-turn-helix transcriptional regulator [Hyphomicrobiaceae bacterium]
MSFTPDASLLHLLHRASQICSERFARTIGDSNLTPRQLIVLSIVDTDPGISQTAIVTATGIDRSTLADIVRRLVQRRLLTRRRSKIDARAYVINLTTEGRSVLATAAPMMARVDADMLAAIPAQHQVQLIGLLAKLIEQPSLHEA